MGDREEKRGEEAKRLLQHPLISEAFAALEARCIENFAGSLPQDGSARERAYRELKAVRDLHRYLRVIMEDGDDALKQREYEERLSKARWSRVGESLTA